MRALCKMAIYHAAVRGDMRGLGAAASADKDDYAASGGSCEEERRKPNIELVSLA